MEKTVKQGETISGYAQEHGVPAKKIWNHEKNSALRARREHGNILHPGDSVYIPDPEQKETSAATGQRHRFERQRSLEVSLAVLDVYHKPLPGVKYHFVVDGEAQGEGNTDGEGIAKTRIPSASAEVVLHLPWGEFPLQVGHLDPTCTIKGIQKRLRNLGIDPGPIDGIIGPKTARAIREFQLVEAGAGLRPTGLADEQTIRRMREVHDKQQLDGIHNTNEMHELASVEDMEKNEMDSETCEYSMEPDELGAVDDFAKVLDAKDQE